MTDFVNVIQAMIAEGVAAKHVGRPLAQRDHECIQPPLGCGAKITDVELETWDQLTVREYAISGWCKTCQDKIFVEPKEDECTCDQPPCCEADIGIGVVTCGDQHRLPCPIHEHEKETRNYNDDPDPIGVATLEGEL